MSRPHGLSRPRPSTIHGVRSGPLCGGPVALVGASIYLARMAWTNRGRFGRIDRCDGWVTWFFRITRQLVHMMIETQFIPDQPLAVAFRNGQAVGQRRANDGACLSAPERPSRGEHAVEMLGLETLFAEQAMKDWAGR